MIRAIAIVALATLGFACAGPLKNQPVCPESKNVSCLTEMDCQYDDKRHCEVCRCKQPAYTPLDR